MKSQYLMSGFYDELEKLGFDWSKVKNFATEAGEQLKGYGKKVMDSATASVPHPLSGDVAAAQKKLDDATAAYNKRGIFQGKGARAAAEKAMKDAQANLNSVKQQMESTPVNLGDVIAKGVGEHLAQRADSISREALTSAEGFVRNKLGIGKAPVAQADNSALLKGLGFGAGAATLGGGALYLNSKAKQKNRDNLYSSYYNQAQYR